jgi:hypothetical protein
MIITTAWFESHLLHHYKQKRIRIPTDDSLPKFAVSKDFCFFKLKKRYF